MVDFAGWELPVWYTSLLEEHKAVRQSMGLFDVSHMGRIRVTGKDAGLLLNKVLTISANRLPTGYGQLCLLCLENGGILDDLWVNRIDDERYLLVWNAGNHEHKLAWLRRWARFNPEVVITDISQQTAMQAVQGPQASSLRILKDVSGLPRFGCVETSLGDINVFASRTGYTGEDGFEIITSNADSIPLWELFMKNGAKACGLGARDSLRLEAGMMLYGKDMYENANPFEAGLAWLVDMDKGDFIGKPALENIKLNGIERKLIAFEMSGREIARTGYTIVKSGREIGKVTSGGYAPTLGISIGLGYVPAEFSSIGPEIEIVIRGKPVTARIVNRRFYKGGLGETRGV